MPIVLEGTISREVITRPLNLFIPIIKLLKWDDLLKLRNSFTSNADITYCIDVSQWLRNKKQSMAAHTSQTVGGSKPRALQVFIKLPRPLYAVMFRREWFSQTRGDSAANPLKDLPAFKS